MKVLDKLVNTAFLLIVGLYVLAVGYDTIDILIDRTEHSVAHVFNASQESWRDRSVTNYVIANVLVIALFAVLFFIGVKKLTSLSSKSLWNKIYYVVLIGFLVAVSYGYYEWVAIGFDH